MRCLRLVGGFVFAGAGIPQDVVDLVVLPLQVDRDGSTVHCGVEATAILVQFCYKIRSCFSSTFSVVDLCS